MSSNTETGAHEVLLQATTNVTLSDFIDSLSGDESTYSIASSATMNDNLQQFVTIPVLVPFAPAVIATAQNLGDLSSPTSLAKDYFGFQVLHQVTVTLLTYGNDAASLTGLIADMLGTLLEGELEPMKYCRLRHLGERHVLVVETFINNLHAGGTVEEEFADVIILRKGVQSGVSILEALYLQTLADDFLSWMAEMGTILQ